MHLTIFSGNGGAKFARKRSFFIASLPGFAQAASLIPESSPGDASSFSKRKTGLTTLPISVSSLVGGMLPMAARPKCAQSKMLDE
jgi:hypothetical protein